MFRTHKLEKQEVMDIVKDLPIAVQETAMTTYATAVAEGEKKGLKKGETIGLKKAKLEIALDLLTDELNMSNQRIAKIAKLPIAFIKNIRTPFQQKELAKAYEVVLKAFKKITTLEKEEVINLKKMIKKHYLKFQKKKK